MKLYQCDMCQAITSESGAMHRVSYTAPKTSNYEIAIYMSKDGYSKVVPSFDRYLCKRCAKQILKPFIDPEFFEEEESNDNP